MRWYLNLNKHEIKTWEDMIDSFLMHYQHNADLAPDKSSLRVLTPSKNERFRAFAQRWRNLAAQIIPPMTENELVDEFMTLTCLANNIKTACATSLTFSQLVKAEFRVEASQGDVFKSEDNSKGKKMEKEVHNISGQNSFNQSIYRAPRSIANLDCQIINISITNSRIISISSPHVNNKSTVIHYLFIKQVCSSSV